MLRASVASSCLERTRTIEAGHIEDAKKDTWCAGEGVTQFIDGSHLFYGHVSYFSTILIQKLSQLWFL